MILTVRNIDEIIVTNIDGEELTVKKWGKFETSEKMGQSYLNSYPQYFKTASDLKAEKSKEDTDNTPTVNELKDLIKELWGNPSGNKDELIVQYETLLAEKAKADADANSWADTGAEANADGNADANGSENTGTGDNQEINTTP